MILCSLLKFAGGLIPSNRPKDHKLGLYPSSNKADFLELGRLEVSGEADWRIVLRKISRHFNIHSLIPDKNDTLSSPEKIDFVCINEIYNWCYSRGYFRLWDNLFVH